MTVDERIEMHIRNIKRIDEWSEKHKAEPGNLYDAVMKALSYKDLLESLEGRAGR